MIISLVKRIPVIALLLVIALPVRAEVTISRDAGRFWFKDGQRQFISLGVTGVRYSGDRGREYSTNLREANIGESAWAKRAVGRLERWGFNTIGPWSDDSLLKYGRLYFAPNLMIGFNMIRKEGAVLRKFPDVYDPQFAERATIAIENAYHRYHGKKLLGFFTDNELDWNMDMLDRFLELPAGSPGRSIAEEYVESNGGSVTVDQREKFLRRTASKYYSTMQAGFRSLPVKVLDLGTRFDPRPVKFNDVVAEVAGKHVDVISVNAYGRNYPERLLQRIYALTQRPILISEFSARGRDSGLPNKKGAGPLFDTQAERGRWYLNYICDGVKKPYIVGFHWYRFVDNPTMGNYIGEDSNNGLVDLHDKPYSGFTNIIKRQLAGCHWQGR